ncbi:MAG: hypothetical protein ABL956_15465 [Hyphomonadaceae bacterium]
MVELLYEVWRDEADGVVSVSCRIAGQEADEFRRKVEPHATFVRAFLATSHQDAMRQYYAAQGWGEYRGICGVTDQPFTEEEGLAQQAYLNQRG